MTQRRYLTESEWNHMNGLLQADDRVGAYAYVRDITGSSMIADMTQISSGTGFVGGSAWRANDIVRQQLENDGDPSTNYFPTGIEDASRGIVALVLSNTNGLPGEPVGGFVRNEDPLTGNVTYILKPESEILASAASYWQAQGIADYFPGRILPTQWDDAVISLFDGQGSSGSVANGALASAQAAFIESANPSSAFRTDFFEIQTRYPGGSFRLSADRSYLDYVTAEGTKGSFTRQDIFRIANAAGIFGPGIIDNSILAVFDGQVAGGTSIVFADQAGTWAPGTIIVDRQTLTVQSHHLSDTIDTSNLAYDNFFTFLDPNATYTVLSPRTAFGGEYLETLSIAGQGQIDRGVIRQYTDNQGKVTRREYFDAQGRRVINEYFLPDVIVNGAVASGGRLINVFDTTGTLSYAATIYTSGAYTPQVISQTALDGLPAIWQTMASTTNPGLGDNIIVVDANGRPVFNTISDGVGGIADGTPLADLALFNVPAASFGVIDDVDLFANLNWSSATYTTSTPTGVPGISVTSAGGEFENFFTNTPDGIWIQEGNATGISPLNPVDPLSIMDVARQTAIYSDDWQPLSQNHFFNDGSRVEATFNGYSATDPYGVGGNGGGGELIDRRIELGAANDGQEVNARARAA